MKGRDDSIPEWTVERKNELLTRVESLFNRRWLSESEPHPLRTLWKRRDMLATTELLTLGTALDQLRGRATQRFLNDVKVRLRSSQVGAREGAAHELISAAVCDAPEHPVELPTPNTPGYDFVLRFGKRRLRVSCKALVSSAAERAFMSAGPSIVECVRGALRPGMHARVMLEHLQPGSNARAALQQLTATLRQLPSQVVSGLQARTQSWRIEVEPLAAPDDLTWLPTHPSFIVVAGSPLTRDEQRRFADKMEEAFSNLRKHCSDVSLDQTNAVMIRIPLSISIAEAIATLETMWPTGTEHVSMVVLHRCRPLADTQRLTHEFVTVGNPLARVPLPALTGRPLRMTALIGVLATNEIPRTVHLDRGAVVQVNGYGYVGGELWLHAQRPEGAESFTVNMPRLPNVRVNYTISGVCVDGSPTISPIYPPRDELILL